jgi:SAM-dependent methyltransferase
MYVIDREAAAREIARVLRPGGRLVAAVWAGPERADIVLLQQTAGSFAPEPPVPGVGPGALSGAATRFTNRVDFIVKEANALGTAYLRADAIAEPHRSQLKEPDYTCHCFQ